MPGAGKGQVRTSAAGRLRSRIYTISLSSERQKRRMVRQRCRISRITSAEPDSPAEYCTVGLTQLQHRVLLDAPAETCGQWGAYSGVFGRRTGRGRRGRAQLHARVLAGGGVGQIGVKGERGTFFIAHLRKKLWLQSWTELALPVRDTGKQVPKPCALPAGRSLPPLPEIGRGPNLFLRPNCGIAAMPF